MIEEDSKDIQFIPLDVATVPPNDLIRHIKDCWWVVHPTKGVVFWVKNKAYSPQCNHNEELAKRFASGMYPWAEVRFIPSVFHKIHPQDFV